MQYDVTIIGAGIVGLATAYKLTRKKPDLRILVIEKEQQIASHQTGHNSGVIHSGLYYKPGSYKAKNCIEGYHELIGFCNEFGIQYDLCGKIVVATDESEMERLNNLFQRGIENGLQGLKKLTSDELNDYEPFVKGVAGIYVPQTGIIDFKQVANTLAQQIFENENDLILGEKVTRIIKQKKYRLVVTDKNSYSTKMIINCAGLYSDKIAKMTGIKTPVRIIPFRGEYYKINKQKEYLVRNLIYPVPDPNFPFLGVHFTRMIQGGVEAGPNAVLAFQREGYKKNDLHIGELFETIAWPGFQKVAMKYYKTGFSEMVRSFSKKAFTRALQKLIPDITEKDLEDGGSGVRAQACDRNGNLLDDFLILEDQHVVNVCNAPSPAATASLAIGSQVARIALSNFKSVSYKFTS